MHRLLAALVCGTLGVIVAYASEARAIIRSTPVKPGDHVGIDYISLLKLGRREAMVAGTALFLAAFVLSR